MLADKPTLPTPTIFETISIIQLTKELKYKYRGRNGFDVGRETPGACRERYLLVKIVSL